LRTDGLTELNHQKKELCSPQALDKALLVMKPDRGGMPVCRISIPCYTRSLVSTPEIAQFLLGDLPLKCIPFIVRIPRYLSGIVGHLEGDFDCGSYLSQIILNVTYVLIRQITVNPETPSSVYFKGYLQFILRKSSDVFYILSIRNHRKEILMIAKSRFMLSLLMLLVGILPACSPRKRLVVPEIKPPGDLIPGYVPDGFELVSGYKLPGKVPYPATSDSDKVFRFVRMQPINLKSPVGNDIQGVYYQSKELLILISKSYFPEGTLDLWRTNYEAFGPKPCECGWADLHLNSEHLPSRFVQIQEERTIGGVRIAVLKGPMGWITVFVRGDYLLTVESGISIEENLKIVASLLEKWRQSL
jgi:hypothetical protein